jgi:hypothetical protein
MVTAAFFMDWQNNQRFAPIHSPAIPLATKCHSA